MKLNINVAQQATYSKDTLIFHIKARCFILLALFQMWEMYKITERSSEKYLFMLSGTLYTQDAHTCKS